MNGLAPDLLSLNSSRENSFVYVLGVSRKNPTQVHSHRIRASRNVAPFLIRLIFIVFWRFGLLSDSM